MPVPFNVNASAVPNVYPFRSSTAPDVILVAPAVVPNGVFVPPPAAPSFNVPALIVVVPVYVLAPDNVKTPLPALVTPNAPVTPMTADTVNPSAAFVSVNVRVAPPKFRFPLMVAFAAPPVDVTLPPRVRVPTPVVTAPPIVPLLTVSAPIASENPFKSYVPPSLTVTAFVDKTSFAPY
jgi:hypothetical protein